MDSADSIDNLTYGLSKEHRVNLLNQWRRDLIKCGMQRAMDIIVKDGMRMVNTHTMAEDVLKEHDKVK